MREIIIDLATMSASQSQLQSYLVTETERINHLLAQYQIVSKDKQAIILTSEVVNQYLFPRDLLDASPLRKIFIEQEHQFAPMEIQVGFQNLTNHSPDDIKVHIIENLLLLLVKYHWDQEIIDYLERHYSKKKLSDIFFTDAKSYSFGAQVYQLTFKLGTANASKVSLVIKSVTNETGHNELFYSRIQSRILVKNKKNVLPALLSSKINQRSLLLSPILEGVSADNFISAIYYRHEQTKELLYKKHILIALEKIIEHLIQHSGLGDLTGRNDRNLSNYNITINNHEVNPLTLSDNDQIYKIIHHINKDSDDSFTARGLDVDWLLGEKNLEWVFADISTGLCEINLLSLLPYFNVYTHDVDTYKSRKEFLTKIYRIYERTIHTLLDQKDIIMQDLLESYPEGFREDKLSVFINNSKRLGRLNDHLLNIFQEYLLLYRTRRVYRKALEDLYLESLKTGPELRVQLRNQGLLDYIYITNKEAINPSVSILLQCFRHVYSQELIQGLGITNGRPWEEISQLIESICRDHNETIYTQLCNRLSFVRSDTKKLLESVRELSEVNSLSENDQTSDSLTIGTFFY